MRGISSALATAEIIALRALLPRWFARGSLDSLLERLSAGKVPGAGSDLVRLARDVSRAEALIERVTKLPRTCLYRALSRYANLIAAIEKFDVSAPMLVALKSGLANASQEIRALHGLIATLLTAI